MTEAERDELETAGLAFQAVLRNIFPERSGHPLPILFNGMMLVYYQEPALLHFLIRAMKPVMDACANANLHIEEHVLLNLAFLMAAAKAAKANAVMKEDTDAQVPR